MDISKLIMKKTYPGHLLIFVHNGKAALARVHLYKTEVERCSCVKKEKDVGFARVFRRMMMLLYKMDRDARTNNIIAAPSLLALLTHQFIETSTLMSSGHW